MTTQELFTPPVGMIKSIPAEKQEDYRKKYAALEPFEWHAYDMDICVMYRQMDELKLRYKDFNGAPFENYVSQIKENVERELEVLKLNKDFYLNGFHCVIKADSRSYLSFLGLFLALSDPLKVVPILEYHLEKFTQYSTEKEGEEYFLGELEYLVCNFLRTNRFPEDYFVKHDKIINWIYAKRNLLAYQTQVDRKLESLITSFNKVSSRKVPTEVIKTSGSNKGQSKTTKLALEADRLNILYEDIKEYFKDDHHAELKNILRDKASSDSKIIFNGFANQLCDVFRIYLEEKYICVGKRATATWICDHFMYYIDSKASPKLFEQKAVENVLYGQDLPPRGAKRIKLSCLSKDQKEFYPKNESKVS